MKLIFPMRKLKSYAKFTICILSHTHQHYLKNKYCEQSGTQIAGPLFFYSDIGLSVMENNLLLNVISNDLNSKA